MTRTQKFKRLTELFTVLSVLFSLGPLIVYTIKACIITGLVEHKLALVSSLVVVLMLTAVCALMKYKPRSLIWFVVIALWLALDNIGTIILWFGITQCIDEFILCPLKKWSAATYKINKEIDKRC